MTTDMPKKADVLKLKKCTSCGQEKPDILENFRHQRHQCKMCEKKYRNSPERKDASLKANEKRRRKQGMKPKKLSITRIINGIIFRTCTQCNKEKEENLDNFYLGRNNKFRTECKICASDFSNKYKINHKEEIKIRAKNYVNKHKKEKQIYDQIRRSKHPEKEILRSTKYIGQLLVRENDLTESVVKNIISKPCHYCL